VWQRRRFLAAVSKGFAGALSPASLRLNGGKEDVTLDVAQLLLQVLQANELNGISPYQIVAPPKKGSTW
jgi:hypothetical protein